MPISQPAPGGDTGGQTSCSLGLPASLHPAGFPPGWLLLPRLVAHHYLPFGTTAVRQVTEPMPNRAANRTRQLRPRRPTSHVVGDSAINTLRTAVPETWIVRDVSPDYGIDCEIEVVTGHGDVSGAIVKAQVKGVAKPTRRSISIPVQTVRYWVALPVPVILVQVVGRDVRWIDVRHYLLMRDRLDQLYRTSKRTVSFSFGGASSLPRDAGLLERLALDHQLHVGIMRQAEVDRVKGDFVGFILLVRMFDNDPDKWLKWLRERGSLEQLETDLPFVAWVKREAEQDPDFLRRIKAMVEEATA